MLDRAFGGGAKDWDLSDFHLDAGRGTRAEQAERDRRILIEALARYGEGEAKIENGILHFTPIKKLPRSG